MSTQTPAPRIRPPGRRRGDSGTRDAILDAALRLFADHGYDATSVRAIAAEAGVDPALVRHFFTDKETLFTAVVTDRTPIRQRLAGCLAGDPATLGQRFTATYFGLWDDPDTRPVLLALVRSAVNSEHAAVELAKVLGGTTRGVVPDPSDARARRFALAGTHLFGAAVARHILKVPVIAAMTHDELVADIAPAIQRYLGPAPPAGPG